MLTEGFETESMDGQRVAPLMGDYQDADVGVLRMRSMPNFWLHGSCDHAVVTRLLPGGLRKTLVRSYWLVDFAAREGDDYDLERMLPFWHLTNQQDWDICNWQQKGVDSIGYEPGPLSTSQGVQRRRVHPLVPEADARRWSGRERDEAADARRLTDRRAASRCYAPLLSTADSRRREGTSCGG